MNGEGRPSIRFGAGGWCIAACCYAPAVWLLDKGGDWKALPVTLATMILFFTPWALLTPALLRASAFAPLGTGRNGWSLAMLVLIGIREERSARSVQVRRDEPL
ncbi:hypothetical protein [Sphingomonas fuzhouensis]|uniref:hypothetical protein n=1 Tax=Sphingomonas fuzhouensis TaxID=3106033 RepID=UPI002AFF5625|nr:hypothetical protein [Sphingomonas sp. SGZ-02]